jgi:hypothetical protein
VFVFNVWDGAEAYVKSNIDIFLPLVKDPLLNGIIKYLNHSELKKLLSYWYTTEDDNPVDGST